MQKFNKNPSIQAYAHHAFVTAIIEGGIEEDDSNVLLQLEVLSTECSGWSNNSIIKQKNNFFEIVDSKEDMYEFVYRECQLTDELIVRVDCLKNTKRNSILNIAIACDDFEKSVTSNRDSYKCGFLHNRVLSRLNSSFLQDMTIDQKKNCYLRISKTNSSICSFISCNGVDWVIIDEVELQSRSGKYYFGFIAEKLAKSNLLEQYENWICSNFLQIKCDFSDSGSVWIDYWNFPHKETRYENVFADNFLDIYYDEWTELSELYSDVLDYVNWGIKHNYFLAICMDEFYIEGRNDYQKRHFYHHNLICGYDEEKESYLLMGYEHKLTLGYLDKETAKRALKNVQGRMMRYKLKPNTESELEFDVSNVLLMLEHFLARKQGGNLYSHILNDHGQFGIDALNALRYSESGKKYLLKDKRVAFFLYEYCIIMKRRIKFLEDKNALLHHESEILKAECEVTIECARRIKNLVVKNCIKPRYDDEILRCYDELYNLLISLMTSLRDCLKNNVINIE